MLGLRDYCHKSGNRRALLGLSGGIDSALTATIAARALGPEQVTGVFMASRYSSPESEEDAIELAERLGLGAFRSVPIESVHGTAQEALGAHVAVEGVTDENLQARLRGVYLMALSNAGQGLVLATSNKSEVAMGYTTLYGDMVGAVGVLGDVLKTTVYDLARWINAHHGPCGFQRSPMPARCLTKAPSAELRRIRPTRTRCRPTSCSMRSCSATSIGSSRCAASRRRLGSAPSSWRGPRGRSTGLSSSAIRQRSS